MEVTDANKAVARYAGNAFGGSWKVRRFHHDFVELSVDVLRCDGQPLIELTSYSTIGLSDWPMFTKDGSEFSVRLELAGLCYTDKELFPNVLASAAFCIMRTSRLYSPGATMPGYVREYYPDTTVPHLYFNHPFVWEDKLHELDCGSKNVAWLLAVPISDGELEYRSTHGDSALESLLAQYEVDIADLDRTPVA